MEELSSDQIVNIGLIQRFWDNLKKVGKNKMTVEYLLARSNLLKNYWTQVLQNHGDLLREGINTTGYMKNDVFAEAEHHYIMTNRSPLIDLDQERTETDLLRNRLHVHAHLKLVWQLQTLATFLIK